MAERVVRRMLALIARGSSIDDAESMLTSRSHSVIDKIDTHPMTVHELHESECD